VVSAAPQRPGCGGRPDEPVGQGPMSSQLRMNVATRSTRWAGSCARQASSLSCRLRRYSPSAEAPGGPPPPGGPGAGRPVMWRPGRVVWFTAALAVVAGEQIVKVRAGQRPRAEAGVVLGVVVVVLRVDGHWGSTSKSPRYPMSAHSALALSGRGRGGGAGRSRCGRPASRGSGRGRGGGPRARHGRRGTGRGSAELVRRAGARRGGSFKITWVCAARGAGARGAMVKRHRDQPVGHNPFGAVVPAAQL
jgi:hypothetical protein